MLSMIMAVPIAAMRPTMLSKVFLACDLQETRSVSERRAGVILKTNDLPGFGTSHWDYSPVKR